MPLRLRPSIGRSRGFGGAGAEHDGIKFLEQFFGGIIFADFGVGDELDAFGFHLFDAAQDDLFLVELHVRDAIHEQAADAIGAFENGDRYGRLCSVAPRRKVRRDRSR